MLATAHHRLLFKQGRTWLYNVIQILIWCIGINYAILIVWFAVLVYAHIWLFKLHARWFKLAVKTFNAINSAAIAIYKKCCHDIQ